MIKWLMVCALSVNFLAFFWFASQDDMSLAQKGANFTSKAGQASEIVLLSELEIIPQARILSVIEAVEVEGLDELALGPSPSTLAADRIGAQTIAGDSQFELDANEPVGGNSSFAEGALDKGVLSEHKPEPELLCVRFGRFDSEQDANDLLAELKQTVGVGAIANAVTEGLVRYLVYMPPFETRAMAKLKQSALQEEGFRSSLYYKGELKNGLSLGYFGSRSYADRRYGALVDAGHGVALKTVEMRVVRYWIVLEGREAAKLSRHFWRDTAERFPNMARSEVDCSSVNVETGLNH
ncbi:MAG: SPOR domain-containing protein [Gammaproteobacteria bacterium]|nr:SPOR domain-containing protein [Gammaproteobacteria bacterium]MBQ0841013.1 SPOR domain-containing protein [Gammaproteobacteria bacterium]